MPHLQSMVFLLWCCDFVNLAYYFLLHNFSQFRDIYQEEHFINYLAPDIRIVRDLPKKLQSLDLEAISSVVSRTPFPPS